MSNFADHLQFLVGSSTDTSDDRRAVDDWSRLELQDKGGYDDLGEGDDDFDTVLDVFGSSAANDFTAYDPLVTKIQELPNASTLLESIYSVLSSPRRDEEISEDLLDMIGYDHVELVMELLPKRRVVASELESVIFGGAVENSLVPMRMNGKGKGRTQDQSNGLDLASLTPEQARRRMEEQFRANAERPLFTGTELPPPEVLPHVYTSSSMAQGNVLSHLGSKYLLPVDTRRLMKNDYEEVVVPPARTVPPRENERLVPVAELDELPRGCFPGYTSLNRIQSIVYPTAYRSNENMLVCAPTGAGKTDVAMLTILRVVDQYRNDNTTGPMAARINRNDFKIIYVAPMKALAAEIVRKMGKRLQWLNIAVRELTGDMQLTKKEIDETQLIVTTPEKWDVVTRKPTGEGEIASKVKLLIIDEVHLLNEERGAVIETIVARTLRQVESSQSVIRIVGLSATLPNYIDVADFLSVSRQTGLFYFDSSFRPVPLEQHFIGVKGKPGMPSERKSMDPLYKKNLDRVVYDKVVELIQQGHQVMVFVHARKETVKSALALREAAMLEGTIDDFSCQEDPKFAFFKRDIGQSRNKEMKQLFDYGFGIHHAGMLRSDRNMMERMFDAKVIKVLCCTATLAWGVNLPAHAVIIKGTQVYDSSKGAFTDLSVLDVLQVFGRAGRPGLETSGEGYICTTEDKLPHYLDAVTSQNPIESQFVSGLVDSLNAEIALGTVANVDEAVRWLGYTYLFVRMRKNPFQYGMARDEILNDPQLRSKRDNLIRAAARKLVEARMINWNLDNEAFSVTDLGRIAAKYYIRHASIEIFNEKFRPQMSEADVLVMLSRSTEFDQIQMRDSEAKELDALVKDVPCAIPGKDNVGTDKFVLDSHGKVNVLLQGHISQHYLEDFALVSDSAYVAQNAGRIIRALLEIAISRKFASTTTVLMGLSKAIEKRLWPFDNPLKQFELKRETLYNLEKWADDYSVAELAEMSADELGQLVRLNATHGKAILEAAKQFPTIDISYQLRPLGPDVLRISVRATCAFKWNQRLHGSAEPFWIWVEDEEGNTILQLQHLLFRSTTEYMDLAFVIAIPNGQPPNSVTIRYVSDRWLGAENEISVPLDSLSMPVNSNSHTPRLDIPFLNLSVLNPVLEPLLSSRLRSFNALQTQAFWSIVNTRTHTLLCSPTGSGKSTLAQIAIWETLARSSNNAYALVIVPRATLKKEWETEIREVSRAMGFSVRIPRGSDVLIPAKGKSICLSTPQQLLMDIMAKKRTASLHDLRLVVCDNLEQLDPDYELAVSFLLHATQTSPTRFIGISNSLNDSADLAAWLHVHPHSLHSFRPRDRDQSLSFQVQTFTIPLSAALFKVMAKPAHAAIQSIPGGSAIVFVPSRGQCRNVAMDLITHCTLETEAEGGYLPADVPPYDLEMIADTLQDVTLKDFLVKGVGIYHEGISPPDRRTILRLYEKGILRVLLVPRDSCWRVTVRAAVVVVMGTQYYHVEKDGADRHLRDYDLQELVRMQGRAVRHGETGRFYLFCQSEDKDTYTRFLEDGLPLESTLGSVEDGPGEELKRWYKQQRDSGAILNKVHAVQALSFTFLAKRLVTNPAYYDAQGTRDETLSRLVDKLEEDIRGEGHS